MKLLRAAPMLLLATLITGCAANVPMATIQQDKAVKAFSQQSDSGGLYIYRKPGVHAASIAFMVAINGKTIGQAAPNTFFYVKLTPGNYSITSFSQENTARVDLGIEAGKNYFVNLEPMIGWYAPRVNLAKVMDNEGRKNVIKAKLIATDFLGEDNTLSVNNLEKKVVVSPSISNAQKLRELQNLKKDGVISDAEYEVKRKQLMNDL